MKDEKFQFVKADGTDPQFEAKKELHLLRGEAVEAAEVIVQASDAAPIKISSEVESTTARNKMSKAIDFIDSDESLSDVESITINIRPDMDFLPDSSSEMGMEEDGTTEQEDGTTEQEEPGTGVSVSEQFTQNGVQYELAENQFRVAGGEWTEYDSVLPSFGCKMHLAVIGLNGRYQTGFEIAARSVGVTPASVVSALSGFEEERRIGYPIVRRREASKESTNTNANEYRLNKLGQRLKEELVGARKIRRLIKSFRTVNPDNQQSYDLDVLGVDRLLNGVQHRTDISDGSNWQRSDDEEEEEDSSEQMAIFASTDE